MIGTIKRRVRCYINNEENVFIFSTRYKVKNIIFNTYFPKFSFIE